MDKAISKISNPNPVVGKKGLNPFQKIVVRNNLLTAFYSKLPDVKNVDWKSTVYMNQAIQEALDSNNIYEIPNTTSYTNLANPMKYSKGDDQ